MQDPHFERTNEVFIRTQIVNGHQKTGKEEKWHFDVQGGELRLNHNNFAQCADLFFGAFQILFARQPAPCDNPADESDQSSRVPRVSRCRDRSRIPVLRAV
jgi:hypothetical protein